ncbi:MAG: UDP-N-acetylenolpyruvoylglucosamine reductase [Acidobacteria bacterium]|nr:MAG: UDP-N-acetylenolpyruvoylglucosamine reductase [Acidobacteriota bacterium]
MSVTRPAGLAEHVPLSGLSTLGVGGPARYYVRCDSADSVARAAAWASEKKLSLLILGGGSNLVVADEGFSGLVLHLLVRGVDSVEANGAVEITAGAGEPWDPLVERAVSAGWAGLECLSGIPGFVGATPMQNVGAYGQDVSETITRVRALDLGTGKLENLDREECAFGYRDSRFKREDRGRYVILGVTYRLRPGGAPSIKYADLERHLAAEGVRAPTLADTRRAVIDVRRRKSMVIDPDDPNRRSVGSFFMNPVVPAHQARRIEADLRSAGALGANEKMPAFPAADGRTKLSAAWLIERAGLRRGYRRGNAGISTNHTLAIVNCGGATAQEVVGLAREIRVRVRDRFGITLSPEPVFVGLEL